MPIRIPEKLPAYDILGSENIFVMGQDRAIRQDIRPLKIAIMNLMPTKIATETQLLRLLGNTPLQVDITLLNTADYKSKHTSTDHLDAFYYTFNEIENMHFDGLIITGAPIEMMAFEEVDYWNELVRVMEWSTTNVYSTLHICWGAQAALYHHYGIPKYIMDKKLFGIFEHTLKEEHVPLFRGFDDRFNVPVSRHSEVREEDLLQCRELTVLSTSKEAGLYIAMAKKGRQIFVTGHSEYDVNTLKNEYDRDIAAGKPIDIPHNYFTDNDPAKPPKVSWRSHANLLFFNWLNYYVYQETPYDVTQVGKSE